MLVSSAVIGSLVTGLVYGKKWHDCWLRKLIGLCCIANMACSIVGYLWG